MAIAEIRIDTRQALAKLDRIPEFIGKSIRARFRTLGQTLRNELRASMPKDSGRASRAIFSKFDRERRENDIAILVGGNLAKAPYLGILERGGRIKPKTGQFLAVPIGRALVRGGAGRARFQARDLKASPQTYGYVRTFVRDDVVLGERANGEIEPVFVLKKELIFPQASAPAPIRKFRDRNEERIIREVTEAVVSGIKEGSRGVGSGGGGD